MLLHTEAQTHRTNDKLPFLFQPSKCERTQRRILHDSGARGLTQQPHVVLVSAPHQPTGGTNAVPHHCRQRDPRDHWRQSGEHELNGVGGLDRQDTVLHSLAVDYAVSIPTLYTSASWILFFSNNQSVFQRKGQWIVWGFFFLISFHFPLPVSSSGGSCFFPPTAFVKPLSLKLDSREGVCLTTDGLWQLLLGCSVFWSVSLINVRGCSTRYLTFIYVLLLLCRDDIPQPCLYIVGFVCLFFFLYRQHFGPSMDPFKAEELVPVFKHMIYTCEWLSDKKFTNSHGQVLLFSGQGSWWEEICQHVPVSTVGY